MEPNYKSYSREELLDALQSIDKEVPPERYKTVELLLEKKSTDLSSSETQRAVNKQKAEKSAEVIFEETKPQYGALRLTLFVIIVFVTSWFLRELERPLYERLIAIIVILILNRFVWAQIKKYRLAKFKASSI